MYNQWDKLHDKTFVKTPIVLMDWKKWRQSSCNTQLQIEKVNILYVDRSLEIVDLI